MFKKRNSSLTLVELLIALVIIGILVILAMPQYEKIQRRAVVAEAYNILGVIKKAQEIYYLEKHSYSPHIYWNGKYWLDVQIPAKAGRYFDYGVCLCDPSGNPDENLTGADKYIAVGRRDTGSYFFPECPHIHEKGEPGIYMLSGPGDDGMTPKTHSHGDTTHSHRLVNPDSIP